MYLDLLHISKKLHRRIDLFKTLNSYVCWDSWQSDNGNCVLMEGKGATWVHSLSNSGNLHRHGLLQTFHPCKKLSSEVAPENWGTRQAGFIGSATNSPFSPPFFFSLESSERRENPKGQHRNCMFNSKGCSCIWGILTWGIEVTCSETHRTTRNISRSHLGKHPLSCQKNDWEWLSVQPAPWHYGIITCPIFWCSRCLGFIYRLTGTNVRYVR